MNEEDFCQINMSEIVAHLEKESQYFKSAFIRVLWNYFQETRYGEENQKVFSALCVDTCGLDFKVEGRKR